MPRLEAIRPRKSPAYNVADFNKALDKALTDTGKAMIRDFKRTTATWDHQPEFRISGKAFKVGRRLVSVTVGTDDAIYGYVSRGTKPHIIRPKKSTRLVFHNRYTAKTKPGRFLSKPGGASGDRVWATEVHHPGTEPRRFEELVAARHERLGTLPKNVQRRWDQLIRRSRR